MTAIGKKPRTAILLLVLGLALGAGAAWESISKQNKGAGAAEPAGVTFPDRVTLLQTTQATGRAFLVYGGADADLAARYNAALQSYVSQSRGLLRRVAVTFISDAEAAPDTLISGLTFLFGTLESNQALHRIESKLPMRLNGNGFELFGRTYSDPGDVVSASLLNPDDPTKLMLVLTGNSDEAILKHIEKSDRGVWYSDYVVWRGGEVIRSGEYGTDPRGAWVYDPDLDQDRLSWTEDYQENLVRLEQGSIILEIPRGLASGAEANALAAQLDSRVMSMANRLGLPAVTPPITVHYYPGTEWKGKLTGEVVEEHADEAGLHAYHVFDPARPAGDGIAEAEALLHRAVGRTRCAWLNAGSILWLADSWLGVSMDAWPGRLKAMGVWLTPDDFIRGDFEHHSYFFSWPASGAYVKSMVDRYGVAGWRDLYKRSLKDPELKSYVPESMPEPVASVGGMPARGRLAVAPEAKGKKRSPERAASFDRGICYAHDYSLDYGYGSEKSRLNLKYMRDSNFVNAVSISPFGYIGGAHDPEIGHRDRVRGRGGNSSETDESLIAETAQSHALGMKVLLSPHLWGRVWCGEWRAESETDWPVFFAEYRSFILHYAALAEYAGVDLFMVGKELSGMAARSAEWRSLIHDIRLIYTGPITYGANWDSEYLNIDWWGAVDFIGVSQYTPLSQSETPTDSELMAGLAVVADNLDGLATRYARPYLLTEVGFTAQTSAAISPWESFDSDKGSDLDLQARCYDAVLKVFSDRPSCAGTYWWKWFTYLPSNNRGHTRFDYPPYGKPAEQVLRRWYSRLKDEDTRG